MIPENGGSLTLMLMPCHNYHANDCFWEDGDYVTVIELRFGKVGMANLFAVLYLDRRLVNK